ncbi:RNA-directed DNA polymerase, eukaryota, reverse transcriptase zinc-binding domain protein [Tanacetum coccineum]
MRSNQQRNRVDTICDENGRIFEGNDVPNPVFSNDDAMFMIRDISDKEVKDALFYIGDNKAPGPNRYTVLFFKKSWPVIGKDVVNAVREFFNTGDRGLRQGEPISPYLLIIVMELFNLIMQPNIGRDKNFQYHFGCKKLKITHVCFADDLIMFCHGDTSSMKVMKRSTEELIIIEHLVKDKEKNVF